MKRPRAWVVFGLVWFAAPGAALPWDPETNYEGYKWSLRRLPLEYSIGPSCVDFEDAETVDLVQRVFDRWEDIDCAYISFEYIGRGADLGLANDGLGTSDPDGYNNVSWCTGCLGCGGALGVASVRGDPENYGYIGECDQYMEDCYNMDVVDWEGVTAQESGHCLGLAHTSVYGATMYPSFVPDAGMETPDADDIEGLCWIYPMEDGCDEDRDCRDDAWCVEGVCMVLPPPPREFGFLCADASECVSGICALDPISEESRCSVECDLSAPACPAGNFCRRFGPCSESYCVRNEPVGYELGSQCVNDVDCKHGLCADLFDGRACALPCDVSSEDPGCTTGTSCWADPEGCGSCREGDPPIGYGDECNEDRECGTGLCAGLHVQYCTSRCETQEECPDGYLCEEGICYHEGDGTLGEPCAENEDCVSRACATVGEDHFCSRECGDDGDCPDGFSCETFGGTAICKPDGELFGGECADNDDCASGLCAHVDDDDYCTRPCEPVPCPSGWECREGGGTEICTKKAPDGCGCRTPGSGRGATGAALALATLALVVFVRRRRG